MLLPSPKFLVHLLAPPIPSKLQQDQHLFKHLLAQVVLLDLVDLVLLQVLLALKIQ